MVSSPLTFLLLISSNLALKLCVTLCWALDFVLYIIGDLTKSCAWTKMVKNYLLFGVLFYQGGIIGVVSIRTLPVCNPVNGSLF